MVFQETAAANSGSNIRNPEGKGKSTSILPSLLSEDELREFDSIYPNMINRLMEENKKLMPEMGAMNDWTLEIFEYNTSGGKKLRGLMVPATYKCLVKEPSFEDMEKAHILGWIVEVLQAASLVADDLVDGSETRRGRPCWYKREGVGKLAVRDSIFLVRSAQRLLQIYFGKTSHFRQLWDCVIDIVHKTVFGQSLDCMSSMAGAADIQTSFTRDRYNAIVKYKTSYYTMYFPVALAMILAGKGGDRETTKKVESLMLEVGHYFQVQDDYLDCFGDDKETGKIGTDIQDNKCSWLIVQALELCKDKPDELKCLLENYGKKDPENVEQVKGIYRELNLSSVYEDFESEMQNRILTKIEALPETIDKQVFMQLFLKIYQRCK